MNRDYIATQYPVEIWVSGMSVGVGYPLTICARLEGALPVLQKLGLGHGGQGIRAGLHSRLRMLGF